MLTWLFKLDPNVVIPTLLGIATYLYHKVAGSKAATINDIVGGAVRSILSEIVDHVPANVPVETYLKGARDYVEQRIWKALDKRGVPKNATTVSLVHAAIEQATSELGKEIARDRLAKKTETDPK